MTRALAFGLRRLRRGWRSGELLILAAAVAVCVAAVSAIGLFTDRVRGAIEQQSGEALGADLRFIARHSPPADFIMALEATGAETVAVTTIPTVVHHGAGSSLASLKAVAPGYPLRGQLRIAQEPFGTGQVTPEVPAPGTAWADGRLWNELGLGREATVQVGAARLRVTAVLEYEPDRGTLFLDMAPRLMMNAADLPATQLLQPGSRAQFSLLVSGSPAVLEQVRNLERPSGVRLQSPKEARAQISSALDRAGAFLDLAVLAATLLSAAAVALCARHHGHRLRDEVAVLKCLGANERFISLGMATTLLALTLVAGAAGVVLGYAAQAGVAALLGELMTTPLPAPTFAPVLPALGFGLILVLGFGLPPIMQARRAAPLRVFQRDWSAAPGSPWGALAAVTSIAMLLWWRTGDARLAVYVLAGTAACGLLLAAAALILIRLLAPLRGRGGTAWRFGIANIMRRRGHSVAQIVALGLAMLSLLLLAVSRNDLLEAWRDRLPPQTPNQFLVNIQPQQRDALRQFLEARGLSAAAMAPMVRSRLVAINGEEVTAESFDDPETQRWINREFNLSWTATLSDDNELIEGEWWGEAGHGQPWLSAEDYAIERLKLKLGDRLRLRIADQEIELTVHNFRKVRWDSFRPNFFLLTPPGILEDAPGIWLASFYLPPERRSVLRELTTRFPNVTVLDLDAMLGQVRAVMDRIAQAVEFIFLFALGAGILVLLAAIESTRGEREREIGLLRALGARRRTVQQSLVSEYAVLGLLAGLVAATAAQGLTTVLASQVFEIPYGLRPMLWLSAGLAGSGLTAFFGWFALRRSLVAPPRLVLSAA